MARRVKRTGGGARRPRGTEEQFYAQMREAYGPDLAERVLALYKHAKAHGSRQKCGRGKSPTTTVWMGEHEVPENANALAVTFWGDGGGIAVNMKYFRWRRTPEEMARLWGPYAGWLRPPRYSTRQSPRTTAHSAPSARTACSPPRTSRRSSASSTKRRCVPPLRLELGLGRRRSGRGAHARWRARKRNAEERRP